MFDERLAGSPVEYLQLNDLAEALQRNLQRMQYAKCLFMMRAWHQACIAGRPRSLPGSASPCERRCLHVTQAPGCQQLQLLQRHALSHLFYFAAPMLRGYSW